MHPHPHCALGPSPAALPCPQYVIPPPRKLPEGVVTVLSVLRFADTPRGCGHVARNVLFDHAHIERTVREQCLLAGVGRSPAGPACLPACASCVWA